MSDDCHDYSAALTLASSQGDIWMDATTCAAFLGMLTPDGQPNRRAFIETVAVRGSFPRPLVLNDRRKVWRKSEVDRWAQDERQIQSAA